MFIVAVFMFIRIMLIQFAFNVVCVHSCSVHDFRDYSHVLFVDVVHACGHAIHVSRDYVDVVT